MKVVETEVQLSVMCVSVERDAERETERQRDRETGRQRDRGAER